MRCVYIRNQQQEEHRMIPEICLPWLNNRYSLSRNYQINQGTNFDLSFVEFISLWSKHRLRKLAELIQSEQIDNYQRNANYAWVLTWKKKAFKAAGTMNAQTACIALRKDSVKTFYIQKGEKQSASARKRIGDAQRGKKISDDHKAAISRDKKGKKQSPEHVAKRLASMARKKAAAAAQPRALQL
jgi:hypothetical protein